MKMKNGKNVLLLFFPFFLFFLRNRRLVDQSALVYPSEAGGTCASKCFPTVFFFFFFLQFRFWRNYSDFCNEQNLHPN